MPPDIDVSPQHTDTVSCRPHAANWIWVMIPAIYGFMAAMAAHAPNKSGLPSPTETAVWETICLLCLLGAIGIALWQIRTRVTADCTGLRWRGIGRWKAARWEEVCDYYEKPRLRARSKSGTAQVTAVSLIETSVGKVGITNLWTHSEALRTLVTQKAMQTQAREWDVHGCRSFDPWPRVFRYDTWQNIWTPRILLKLCLTALGYLLSEAMPQAAIQAGLAGWPLKLALFAPFLFLFFLCVGAFFVLFAPYRAAHQRKAERITADTKGIVFEDGARQVKAAWADVTGYGISHGPGALTIRYVLDTPQGDFDFLATLSEAMLLLAIIRRYAEDAADKEWRPRVDMETLGGEAARWSGGQAGVGARVYHYRTRVNRAGLWLPLALCVTLGFEAWAAWQGILPGTQAVGVACAAMALGLVFLGGWYGYRVCRLETDEDGLTQVMPFSRRRLAWAQVEDYWLTGEYSTGVVQGRGQHLSFSSSIVGYEELKAEIARRATECGGKAWERKGTLRGNPALKRRAK